jgi:hypothetical protein
MVDLIERHRANDPSTASRGSSSLILSARHCGQTYWTAKSLCVCQLAHCAPSNASAASMPTCSTTRTRTSIPLLVRHMDESIPEALQNAKIYAPLLESCTCCCFAFIRFAAKTGHCSQATQRGRGKGLQGQGPRGRKSQDCCHDQAMIFLEAHG